MIVLVVEVVVASVASPALVSPAVDVDPPLAPVVGSPPVLAELVVTESVVDPAVDPDEVPVSLPAPLSSVDPAPPGVQAIVTKRGRWIAATELMEPTDKHSGVLASATSAARQAGARS